MKSIAPFFQIVLIHFQSFVGAQSSTRVLIFYVTFHNYTLLKSQGDLKNWLAEFRKKYLRQHMEDG